MSTDERAVERSRNPRREGSWRGCLAWPLGHGGCPAEGIHLSSPGCPEQGCRQTRQATGRGQRRHMGRHELLVPKNFLAIRAEGGGHYHAGLIVLRVW